MNMRRQVSALVTSSKVTKDVKRIEVIWSECLAASGGPFLFGDFCIADGMFAPIVNRLAIYELSATEAVQKYTSAITALEPWQEWTAAARKEEWEIAIDEV
jgi:glutathione S-transferase